MAGAGLARAATSAALERFSGLSAGSRLIILLSLALLPLGLLAILASLQISRSADLERGAAVRIASLESARRLGAELAVDSNALRSAVNLLDRGADEPSICGRTQSVLATSFGEPTRFAIVSRGGRLICGRQEVAARMRPIELRQDMLATLSDDGLLVLLPSDTRAFVSVAWYSRPQLARILHAAGFTSPYNLTINGNGRALDVIEKMRSSRLSQRQTVTVDVPNAPLQLVFTVPTAPLTSAEILTMLVPLIMWLVASLVAWIVFDRLVIQPLHQLRANVSNYQPGEILQPLRRMTIPAREIEELGQTFQSISQTVAAHEEELALGLSRQTKLTREVHHRVKNNLQVVSSLINLHARAARSPEATAAYASISRRVDALAVVHRNHYAELEENRGVNLRSLVGELSANLRATAPGEASRLAIMIDVPPLYVGQDTAIPIAFLVTELVELAMTQNPAAAVRVSVLRRSEPDRACLVVGSPALIGTPALTTLIEARYGRILEGLSRQLRSPLERDDAEGSYKVCFPTVATDAEPARK